MLLYLASQSPRRAELLRLLGVAFSVVAPDVDESPQAGESPAAYTARVAALKASTAHGLLGPGTAVLAADTSVSIDGEIFGKPQDAAHAQAMLRRLSGRWHEVHSAVELIAHSGEPHRALVTTQVEFACFDDSTIGAYWATGEPADKAGAYAIQGLGGALVTRIEGSYSAVVGLPLAETTTLLDAVGIRHRLSP